MFFSATLVVEHISEATQHRQAVYGVRRYGKEIPSLYRGNHLGAYVFICECLLSTANKSSEWKHSGHEEELNLRNRTFDFYWADVRTRVRIRMKKGWSNNPPYFQVTWFVCCITAIYFTKTSSSKRGVITHLWTATLDFAKKKKKKWQS